MKTNHFIDDQICGVRSICSALALVTLVTYTFKG